MNGNSRGKLGGSFPVVVGQVFTYFSFSYYSSPVKELWQTDITSKAWQICLYISCHSITHSTTWTKNISLRFLKVVLATFATRRVIKCNFACVICQLYLYKHPFHLSVGCFSLLLLFLFLFFHCDTCQSFATS